MAATITTSCCTGTLGWAVVALGLLALVALVYRVAMFFHRHFLRGQSLSKYGEGTGAWAVVTGATDGIGLGFVEVLAKRGFNVVLVSRDATKLQNTAERIQSEQKVQARTVAIDAANTSNITFQTILSALTGLDVSILINNVGVANALPVELENHTDDEIENMINVNCMFTTKLTRHMIAVLRRRQRSFIVNLSSMLGVVPIALMSVYSASKAYDDALSRAIAAEVKEYGIDVYSITTGTVVSKMSGFKSASLQACSAQRLANDTLNQLGVAWQYSPYWFHDFLLAILPLMPERVAAAAGKQTMKQLRTQRLEEQKKDR